MLVLIFWATVSVAQTSAPRCLPGATNQERDDLHGRVKVVRTFKIVFRKDQQTGKLIRGNPQFEGEVTYDAKGKLTNSRNPGYRPLPFDPNNQLIVEYECDGPTRIKEFRYRRIKDPSFTKTVYSYDDKGREVERAKYFADGTLETLQKYSYDSEGNLQEEILKQHVHPVHFSPKRYDVYVTTKTAYGYDNKRNKIRETHHRPDGSVYATWVFQYDNNNNLIKDTRRDNLGRLNDQFIYKYDRQNRLVEEKHYQNFCYERNGEMCKGSVTNDDGVFYYLTRITYDYDRRGNWVRQRQFSMGGDKNPGSYQPDEFLIRRITYHK